MPALADSYDLYRLKVCVKQFNIFDIWQCNIFDRRGDACLSRFLRAVQAEGVSEMKRCSYLKPAERPNFWVVYGGITYHAFSFSLSAC